MGFQLNTSVLNQKGSPAIYTDTFANRPPFGYAGRLFISNDTAAIYEDTGTAWVLIANVSSGAGTLQQVTTNGNTSNVGISVTAGGVSTNSATITSLTQGSVPFVGAAGLITQDNANLFFDDTNNRLGINTNTPSNNLDVHGTGTTALLALNNTSSNQSLISFLKNSTAKWRIGNSSTDTFDVLNVGLTTNAISISNASNCVSFLANLLLKQSTGFQSVASFNGIACDAGGFFFQLGTSNNVAYLNFIGLTAARTFTFPDAAGTLALTSDLSAYLLKTGGTLTGNLTISVATGLSALTLNNASLSGKNWSLINTTNGLNSDLSFFCSGTSGGTHVTFANNGFVGLGTATPSTTLDVVGSGIFSGSLTANAGTITTTLSAVALNMNNMSALGSVGGGSIFMPSTAAIAFRSANGAIGYGNIKADTTGTLFINNLNEGPLAVGAGTLIDFSGTTCRFYGNGATNTFGLGAANVMYYQGDANQFYPTNDGTRNLGAAANRYNTVFATTALINTSDINEKEQIEELTQSEKNVAIKLKELIKKFKYKDAVNLKGNKARIHIGVIAQEVKEAFDQEGLNADEYGMFCSDTWFELDGVKVENDTEGAIEKTRLGIRYEELIIFIISQI